MADKEDERQPLLQNEGPPELPPQYTPGTEGQGYGEPTIPAPQQVTVPPIGPDELPPPYTPSAPGGVPMISCKVCQAMVSIEGKMNQHVVKCHVCNEATPIKAAPPGKKYVRCPCNCLLICRASAQKIACPRQVCKRIINLGGPGTMPSVTVRSPGTNRVECVYCNQTFLFGVVTTPLARCPHCRRVSSVMASFTRNRGLIFLILGIVFLGAGVGVTVGTFELASSSGGIYTVWIGAFIVGLIFLIRAAYMLNIRTSQILGPAA